MKRFFSDMYLDIKEILRPFNRVMLCVYIGLLFSLVAVVKLAFAPLTIAAIFFASAIICNAIEGNKK